MGETGSSADAPDHADASAHVASLLERAIAHLESAGVADEALAVMRPARGILPAKLTPAGRAWRLGVLLLGRDRALYSTGSVTRAVEPLRGVTNRSVEATARRADRHTAARGRFVDGEVVNFGFEPIATDAAALASESGVLNVRDGVVMLRWNPADAEHGIRPLEQYLADRLRVTGEVW